MAGKAAVIPIEGDARELELTSGRALRVRAHGADETLEIVEASGTVSLTVRLTPEGPVIVAQGARLEVRAAESIDLAAKNVSITADESLAMTSKGTLSTSSDKAMRVHSEDEVRVTGRMIHLN
ncbi:MAG: hypothetical protein AB7E47_09065 [Desulfovibrionaceae bacterium]